MFPNTSPGGRLAYLYRVRIIAFGRRLDATGRWPAPRAHADLTHSPEIVLALKQKILEQLRDRNLP